MNRQSSSCVELLCAVQSNNVESVINILSTDEDTNLINKPFTSLEITPLHAACTLEEDNGLLMTNVLLEYGANLNLKDKLGRTPLYIAVENRLFEIVKLLIDEGADVNTSLLADNHCFQEAKFYLFDQLEMLPSNDCYGRTPLHQAVRNNDKKTVELLLRNGASVDEVDMHGITPILLAGANVKNTSIEDYEEIIRLLIEYKANIDACTSYTGATPLHNAVEIGSIKAVKYLLDAGARIKGAKCGQTPLHDAAKKRNTEILSLLLEHSLSEINRRDNGGKTPLHAAAFAGCRECVELLVNKGGNLAVKTNMSISVLDAIFKNVPRPVHLLKNILDKKITCNTDNYNSADFKLIFDFRVFSSLNDLKQMSVISSLIEAGKNCQISEIIQHPLTETYLRLKWYRLRLLFIILVITYVTFVLSLSIYVLLLLLEKPTNVLVPFSLFCFKETCRYIALFSSIILLVQGVIQSIFVPRNFIVQYEHWINLLCSVLSLFITINPELNFSDYINPDFVYPDVEIQPSQIIPSWKLHVMSTAVLLAWIQLMMLIGRFPTFGYYALMFGSVLQNVIKVLLTFVCLVIGFTLSFCVQFHQQENFDNPWKAFVSVFVMMMGEYQYSDMFKDSNDNKTMTATGQYLPVTSRIIFLVFVVIASIVLMNLMIGLAVNDIQKLKLEGQVQKLIKQAIFVTHFENVLSSCLFNSNCLLCILPKYFQLRYIPVIIQFKPGSNMNDKHLKKVLTFHIIERAVEIALKAKQNEHEDKQLIKSLYALVMDLKNELMEIKTKINSD